MTKEEWNDLVKAHDGVRFHYDGWAEEAWCLKDGELVLVGWYESPERWEA